MAFGAGALLFALTIELFSEMLHRGKEHGHEIVLITILGAILGGLFFDLLNQLLNNRGAFLRSLSRTKKYLTRMKTRTVKRLIHELSEMRLLNSLPPDDIADLIPNMKRENLKPEDVIFEEGEMALLVTLV